MRKINCGGFESKVNGKTYSIDIEKPTIPGRSIWWTGLAIGLAVASFCASALADSAFYAGVNAHAKAAWGALDELIKDHSTNGKD